ncbi:MAG: IclR family transcriptional regulator [Kiritimatiellia bacterium]
MSTRPTHPKTHAQPPQRRPYDVPGLRFGFRVLETINATPQGATLSEIATRAKLPISTTFRLVGTLEDIGILRRAPDGRTFHLTAKIFEFSRKALAETSLKECALATMREVRNRVVDTVLLGVRIDTSIVVVDQVIGKRMFSFVSKLGNQVGLGYSAPGRAILAHLPPAETKKILPLLDYPRLTPNTLTTPAALRRCLKTVLARGYAIDQEEHRIGVYCAAAPIFDSGGYPFAAIWTSGLIDDAGVEHLDAIGRTMRSAADAVTQRLRNLPDD